MEEKALGMAIEEVWEESGKWWRPWAANGRDEDREIVLIVNSDTVVPEDCLHDAARERACLRWRLFSMRVVGFRFGLYYYY